MNNLFDVLIDLATAPKKQLAFAGAPKQFMEALGLAELDKQLIESGQKERIDAAFASEKSVLAVGCFDPVEDPLPDPDPPETSDS